MVKRFGDRRHLARAAAWMAAVGLLFMMSLGGTALAQESRVLDPTLSLTGNCSTSSVDPVEDPGCPGGTHPPSGAFSFPDSITTDAYGDIYVASRGAGDISGSEGRIDIFDPTGIFITELLVPSGPQGIAVDDAGNLYVTNVATELLRYSPTSSYDPANGDIDYEAIPVVVGGPGAADLPVAVNPLNQHVFVDLGPFIVEYSAASEGNNFIGDFGSADLPGTSRGAGLAIDASRGRVYVNDYESNVPQVKVFELDAPHDLIETIDGSTTPPGEFGSLFLSLAVDEASGNIFVYDAGAEVIYELGEHGEYLATIDQGLKGHYVIGAQPVVDNGAQSPNGALNPAGRYLFVPAYPNGTGHAFAFAPLQQCPPSVESVGFAGATETEVQLQGSIIPCFPGSSYVFEYTTQQKFEEQGFAGAIVAGSGQISEGNAPVSVSTALVGLSPGTAYRFRLVASNESGSDEAEGNFSTYPGSSPASCPNDVFRTGASALLPDCRAYELVTPPSTSAHLPTGLGLNGEFATREVDPGGNQLSFVIEGGGIGDDGVGSFSGDPYRATRGDSGWGTSYTGPSALEAATIIPGSNSPDQGFAFWTTASPIGSASVEGQLSAYLQYPDGHAALIGRGSLRVDPKASGRLISDRGSHVVFLSSLELEDQAPPPGTSAIYDRTIDPDTGAEETHVVSLMPGNVTPTQNAFYEGASLDGRGIAFSVGSKLYLRYENQETFEIGEDVTFAGVAEGGRRVFYLEDGNLFAFEIGRTPIAFSTSGDVTPVNIASSGAVAYFTSPSVLVGRANPEGVKPVSGQENLYQSREGALLFVGTVTDRDVEGEFANGMIDGLGLWTTAVGPLEGPPGRFGIDPSRTIPEGSVLLFQSRAALTGYDTEGHVEVYRYDSAHKELACVSCNPTLARPTGQASLMTLRKEGHSVEPLGPSALLTNLTPDGRRAFFQSTEALVPGDNDGLQDVYEWEADGTGTCIRSGGCVELISSGRSERADYLYAVSDSGDDVFFRTSDILLGSDQEETPSIYDARVGGGFPEPPVEEPCQGEGCRPDATQPPALGAPGVPARGAHDNVKPRRHCPKGKRKARRHGKTRCVKRHHRHHKRTAGQEKKGAGK